MNDRGNILDRGAKIRDARERAGLSLMQLAEMSGASKTTIANIETGRSGTRSRAVVDVERALGIGELAHPSAITRQERQLIDDFRGAPADAQMAARALIRYARQAGAERTPQREQPALRATEQRGAYNGRDAEGE